MPASFRSLVALAAFAMSVTAQNNPIITSIAGTGQLGFSGDGGPATLADLGYVYGLAADQAGNVYFGDWAADLPEMRIRRVDVATGIVMTVAGGGSVPYPNDGELATDVLLTGIGCLAMDTAGNLYLDDYSASGAMIRRVDAVTGIITTIAGGAEPTAFTTYPVAPWLALGVNGQTQAIVPSPTGIGDGGPATSAHLESIEDIAVDASGNVYVTDFLRVRRIDAITGTISTVAGNGELLVVYVGPGQSPGALFMGAYSGDGGPAVSAGLGYPVSIALDALGNLFITDSGDFNATLPLPGQEFGFSFEISNWRRLRKVDAATGLISTVTETESAFGRSRGLAFDAAGNLFLGDGHVIRRLDKATGVITTIAGSTPGFAGDGGPATLAQLGWVGELAIDGLGNLLLADMLDGDPVIPHIRKITGAASVILPPVANAGPNQSIHASGVIQLDGSASFDDNTSSVNLSYSWSLASAPAGSQAALSGTATAAPTLTVDVLGTYVVRLVVTDEDGLASAPDDVVISSYNLPPVADAGLGQAGFVSGTVLLDGRSSSDPDIDPLSYYWYFTSLPTGSVAVLQGDSTDQPSFVADFEGTYRVALVVFDGFDVSPPDEVVITVVTGNQFAENSVTVAVNAVAVLPAGSVTNGGNQKVLVHTLARALQDMQSDDYADARRELERAIVRTDGVVLRGTPDTQGHERDWVTNPAEQVTLYWQLYWALQALPQ